MITAGNSSQISDGLAALLFMSAEKAELGLKPLPGCTPRCWPAPDPVIMLTAPIPATQKALEAFGPSLDQIGVFEVNEAFAPVPLAWLKDIGADEKKLNPMAARSHWVTRWRFGCPHHDHDAASHARQGNSVRSADDVRGRRPGQRHHPRAAVTDQHPDAPGALTERRATS